MLIQLTSDSLLQSDGKGYEEEDVSDKEESSPSAAGTKEQTKKSLPLSMVPEEGNEDEDVDSEPNEQPGVSLPDIGETSTDPGPDKGTVDRTTAKGKYEKSTDQKMFPMLSEIQLRPPCCFNRYWT